MAERRQVVHVLGRDQLLELANDLRRHADSRERIEWLSYELRKKAMPLARRVRVGALAIPSSGWNARHGVDSLRMDIAKSVSVNVITRGERAGVRVFLHPKKMPTGRKALGKYMNATPGYERWRHPLFGNYEKWYGQKSHPFFDKAIAGAEKDVQEAAEAMLDRLERDLETK